METVAYQSYKTLSLLDIHQGSEELYPDFEAQLLKVRGCLIADPEAGKVLMKQLTFENANMALKESIWGPFSGYIYKRWLDCMSI